jgi:hypothetical protein
VRLIPGGDEATRFVPTPWEAVRLENFRSFRDATVPLGTLTLVEGLNGTGKSSAVEALELLWSGASQRKPVDETSDSYDKHLRRDGRSDWRVSGLRTLSDLEPVSVDRTRSAPAGALARNVFSQDGSADIARETKKERYAELLRITGLAIPELRAECERMNRSAKAEVDSVLVRLGIAPLTNIRARAIDHVQGGLARLGSVVPPSSDIPNRLEVALASRAAELGVAYRPLGLDDSVLNQVRALELTAAELSASLRSSSDFVDRVNRLHEEWRALESEIETRAGALHALSTAASVQQTLRDARPTRTAPATPPDAGIPFEVATRWAGAGRLLQKTLKDLQASQGSVTDPLLGERLAAFTELAERAISQVPFDELETVIGDHTARSSQASDSRLRDSNLVDESLFELAGLSPADGLDLTDVLSHLGDPALALVLALREYGANLSQYRAELLASPLMRLQGQQEALVESLTKFELAKRLKAPLETAQETLIGRLIAGPLEPLLVELIAALTRFEWYFHPFHITVEAEAVEMTGLATPSDDLDVRMLLNTGERAIVTTAWFLALHLLQPSAERRVLVLDDPFSSLDENNQAALIATVRTLGRLTTPDLLVLCSHDRTVADAVEREFAVVNEWPRTFARLRFSRASDGVSVVDGGAGAGPEADYGRELARLGLRDPSGLVAR